jgi:hypothetical protein
MDKKTMTFVDGARLKLGLGPEWKWVIVYQCTANGKKDLRYDGTGYCKVTLRHGATKAECTVVLADAEWKDMPCPERAA